MHENSSKEPGHALEDSPVDLVGAALGEYRIREEVGGGSQSQVFMAVGPEPPAAVAIKVFSGNIARKPRDFERLQQSLRTVARLDRPGIPRILGSGVVQGRPYIIMPFFDSGSLRDRLQMGLISLADLPDALNGIVHILSCAHSYDVVHGSLKPAEILFDCDGQMQLIGLGQTMDSPPHGARGKASSDDIYLSPEVLRGESPTPASDQYSLAMIALEMAAGCDPRDALHLIQLSHADRPPQAARRDRSQSYLPPRVAHVLGQAMADDPAERFPSVADMQAALQAALYDTPLPAASPPAASQGQPSPRRKRSTTLPLLATAAAAVLCLITAMPALSSSDFRGFDLERYASVLMDALTWQDGSKTESVLSPAPSTEESDPKGSMEASEQLPSGNDDGGLPSVGPSQPPAVGGDPSAAVAQPTEPEADADTNLPSSTDEPDPTMPPEPTSTPTPVPTSTQLASGHEIGQIGIGR